MNLIFNYLRRKYMFRIPDLERNHSVTTLKRQVKLVAGNTVSVSLS